MQMSHDYTTKIVSQNLSAELVWTGKEKSVHFKGATYKAKDLNEICNNKDLQKATLLFSQIICHLYLNPYYNFIANVESFKNSPISEDLVVRVDKNRAALLIQEPAVVDHSLKFYVSQTGTGVPYCVKVNLDDPKIKIEDI